MPKNDLAFHRPCVFFSWGCTFHYLGYHSRNTTSSFTLNIDRVYESNNGGYKWKSLFSHNDFRQFRLDLSQNFTEYFLGGKDKQWSMEDDPPENVGLITFITFPARV